MRSSRRLRLSLRVAHGGIGDVKPFGIFYRFAEAFGSEAFEIVFRAVQGGV